MNEVNRAFVPRGDAQRSQVILAPSPVLPLPALFPRWPLGQIHAEGQC